MRPRPKADAIAIMQPTFAPAKCCSRRRGVRSRAPSGVVAEAEAPSPLERVRRHVCAVRPMTGDRISGVHAVTHVAGAAPLVAWSAAAAVLALADGRVRCGGCAAGPPDRPGHDTASCVDCPRGPSRRRGATMLLSARLRRHRCRSRAPRSSRAVPAGGLRPVAAATVIRRPSTRGWNGPTRRTTKMLQHLAGVRVGRRRGVRGADTRGDRHERRVGRRPRAPHHARGRRRSRNYHARPSPDGARVAFDSDRDGERAVFVADANGRNLRRVSGDGFAAVPNWSPDGRTLSFARAELDNPERLEPLGARSRLGRVAPADLEHQRPAAGRLVVSRWPAHRLQPRQPASSCSTSAPARPTAVSVAAAGRARRRAGGVAGRALGDFPGGRATARGCSICADGSSRKVLSDPTVGGLHLVAGRQPRRLLQPPRGASGASG